MVLTLALWHRTSPSPWQDSVARHLVPYSFSVFCCLNSIHAHMGAQPMASVRENFLGLWLKRLPTTNTVVTEA